MPNVLIHGAGAIGSVYAHMLNLSPNKDITLSLTARSNFQSLTINGLGMTSDMFGEHHFYPNVMSSTNLSAISPVNNKPWDFILVTTKAFPNTAETIASAVSPTTTIALLQNGINIEQAYQKLYPSNTIISVSVMVPATSQTATHVRHGPAERLQLGTYPSTAPPSAKAKAEELASLLRSGGSSVEVHDDIQRARWEKVAVNATWNTTCALTRLSSRNVVSNPVTESLMRGVFTEVICTAHAAGYKSIDANLFQKNLDRVRARTDNKEPSMLMDVRHGRQLETWAILGNFIAVAEEVGVDVPGLRALEGLCAGLNSAVALGTLDQSTEAAVRSGSAQSQ